MPPVRQTGGHTSPILFLFLRRKVTDFIWIFLQDTFNCSISQITVLWPSFFNHLHFFQHQHDFGNGYRMDSQVSGQFGVGKIFLKFISSVLFICQLNQSPAETPRRMILLRRMYMGGFPP